MAEVASDPMIGMAAVYGLVEIIKIMIKNRNKNSQCLLDKNISRQVDSISTELKTQISPKLSSVSKILSKEDDMGRHLIYTPKSLHESHENQIRVMADIVRTQKETARILSLLAQKIEDE